MTGTVAHVLVAAVVFVGSHFLLSFSPVRSRVVAAIGERFFMLLYSAVAVAAIVWLVASYNRAPIQELWPDTAWARYVMLALGFIATLMLVAGATSPNPTATGAPPSILEKEGAARGIFAITRHPILWGIALWALGHLLVNGDAASVVFFGAMLALPLGGVAHIDAKRRAAGGEAWRRLEQATSAVPFAALIAGRTTWAAAHVAPWRVGLGIAVYAVFLYAHGPVIGLEALPI